MSSVVADSSTVKLGGSKIISNGSSAGGAGCGSALPLKRKSSQDAGTATHEDVLGSIKRPKASSATGTANGNKTTNGVGGIATNTIMITNNYSSKDGLTPTSSTTTTTSNSSKITILARDVHEDDDEDNSSSPPPLLHHHHRHRPMVVDQINICINNHFSTGDAPLTMTTTTASATAKLPELIKIQKKTKQNMSSTGLGDEEPKLKLGYEEDVKPPTGLAAMLDIEQQVQGFMIKKEPGLGVVEVEKDKSEKGNQKKSGEKQATESAAIVHKFSIGEEVLVPRKSLDDSCFYLGILTVMRDDQCLVQFEDGTNCWAGVKEMRRLMRAPNTVYCVICKTRELQSDVDDDQVTTVECVSCARAYHKLCLRRELSELAKKYKKGGGGSGMETNSTTTTNCLRCFTRNMDNKEHVAADDEDNDVEMEEETAGLVAGKSQERGGKGARKSNSSNTGKTTRKSSVISQQLQQVEIGAPSMDWFTKERPVTHLGVNGGGGTNHNNNNLELELELATAEEEDEGEAPAKDEATYCDANGRRLRKRQEKMNYKDIQRRSGGGPATFPSSSSQTSWSCSSSTSSSASWCATSSSVVSSLVNGGSLFTLDELRWAFLPKSHRSKRRSVTKKPTTTATAEKRQSVSKVPYEKTTAEVEEARAGAAAPFETKSRLARGDKFVVRGKRQDALGNVQYLLEWGENGGAA